MALGALNGWEPLLLLALSALILGIWLATLKDIFRSSFKSKIYRWLWVGVVILMPLIGSVLYFLLGKQES
ncbi:PLD nuclease N-terminal domain-containing protein [Catalinimonas locisalis]|uniref:PLD nuclease N-terminal domain-containing protein n=1 Tax=Catalinimonas locisalis TaxID=3133978 RepID=UPI00403F1CAD